MDMTVRPQVDAPRILVFATARWQLAARMAISFLERGCVVSVLVPRGHPAECVRGISAVHRFTPLRAEATASKALRRAQPELVVPCDDAAVLLLQRLVENAVRGRQGGIGMASAVDCTALQRSLGNFRAGTVAGSRAAFLEFARRLGIRTPAPVPSGSLQELQHWMATHGAGVVLKTDFSFGGQGVVVARDVAAAERGWFRLRHRPGLFAAAGRSLLDRDPTPLADWWRAPDSGLSAQAIIDGHPANRAVVCWRGEVLAGISVESLRQQHATGPATVVRVIHSAEMEEAARRVVSQLGLSGFAGFDFMIEAATGHAHLIEMNPRATPACHLPDPRATAMTGALLCRLRNAPLPVAHERPGPGLMVLFPGEWRADPGSPYLRSAGHDVPWEHPALVRDGLAPPWTERGWLSRLWRWRHVRR